MDNLVTWKSKPSSQLSLILYKYSFLVFYIFMFLDSFSIFIIKILNAICFLIEFFSIIILRNIDLASYWNITLFIILFKLIILILFKSNLSVQILFWNQCALCSYSKSLIKTWHSQDNHLQKYYRYLLIFYIFARIINMLDCIIFVHLTKEPAHIYIYSK